LCLTDVILNTFVVLCVFQFCFRNEKELMKALETPEEKRARRLAKKVLVLWSLWIF